MTIILNSDFTSSFVTLKTQVAQVSYLTGLFNSQKVTLEILDAAGNLLAYVIQNASNQISFALVGGSFISQTIHTGGTPATVNVKRAIDGVTVFTIPAIIGSPTAGSAAFDSIIYQGTPTQPIRVTWSVNANSILPTGI